MGRLSGQRIQEISLLLAKSNKLAIEVSEEILGNKKQSIFRDVLRGKQVTGVSESQLALIKSLPDHIKKCALEADSVRDEVSNAFVDKLYQVSKKYSRIVKGLEAEALVGEAWIGLIKAIYGYTDTRYKLTTYIRQSLRRFLERHINHQHSSILNVRSSYYDSIYQMTIQAQSFLASRGIRPTYENIIDYIKANYNERKIKKCETRILDVLVIQSGVSRVRSSGVNEDADDHAIDVAIEDEALLKAKGDLPSKDYLNTILKKMKVNSLELTILKKIAAKQSYTSIGSSMGLKPHQVKKSLVGLQKRAILSKAA